MIPSAQDGTAFSRIARREERIQKNRPSARFFLLHGVDQRRQALALMRSRAVIRDEDGKPLRQAALQGLKKRLEALGVVIMRNDEVGFQVNSRRLTTEVTEITEGKSDGGHFPPRCRLVEVLLIGRVAQSNSFYLLEPDF